MGRAEAHKGTRLGVGTVWKRCVEGGRWRGEQTHTQTAAGRPSHKGHTTRVTTRVTQPGSHKGHTIRVTQRPHTPGSLSAALVKRADAVNDSCQRRALEHDVWPQVHLQLWNEQVWKCGMGEGCERCGRCVEEGGGRVNWWRWMFKGWILVDRGEGEAPCWLQGRGKCPKYNSLNDGLTISRLISPRMPPPPTHTAPTPGAAAPSTSCSAGA
eukprot:285682-Chlamydomonas_euryale.AAC.3